VKNTRFDRLLASTALALVLALSSQAGMAQQTEKPVEASVPMPDTSLPPPLTAKDVEAPAKQVAPANRITDESKQSAATPSAEPAKAATAPAAAPVPTADSGVADKLRELIGSRQFERLVGLKADRAGIEAFYSARNYAPLWVTNNAGNERAKAAIAYLAQADTVGLDPSDYRTPDFKSAATADVLAEAELKLTATSLMFARHAQIGRIHFTRVGADIQYDLVAPDPADVLAKLADSNDAGKVLDGFNPPQLEFKTLKAKLAELRKGPVAADSRAEAKPEQPRIQVPDGKILRPGMKDARVVALRKRLDVAGDKDNPLYDDAVRDAVKTFQTESDIGVDGNLGPNTVRALNGEQKEARHASGDPIDTIIKLKWNRPVDSIIHSTSPHGRDRIFIRTSNLF
jgi:murein L,D-transpeptidase YcbB/YkuD